MTRFRNKFKNYLWDKNFFARLGIVNEDARALLSIQIFIAFLSFLLVLSGILAAFFDLFYERWSRYFFLSVLLATANFFFLVKVVQRLLRKPEPNAPALQEKPLVGLLIHFYGRLVLTALVLYALLVLAEAPVVAIIAGISTVPLSTVIWVGRRGERRNITTT